LFGNSRLRSPRGMLMREGPFSGGGRAPLERSWRGGFSRIPDLREERDQQGRGASGVREVNLAGIPQQQTAH